MNRKVIETQLFSEEYNDEKRQLPEIVLLDMRPLLLYTFGHDKEKGPGCANSQRVRRRGRQLHHAALHPLAYLSISLQSHTRKDVRCSHATRWSPVLGTLRGYKCGLVAVDCAPQLRATQRGLTTTSANTHRRCPSTRSAPMLE